MLFKIKSIALALLVGRKFTVFALFFVFEGNFHHKTPGAGAGAYIWRAHLTEGFLRYEVWGLYLEGRIHGGAYFRNFTVYLASRNTECSVRVGGGIWATDYLIFLESPNYSRLDGLVSSKRFIRKISYTTHGKFLLPGCGFLEFKYFMA